MNYRATINDNMLVVVMIETLEGVANANEIASTFGVDVVIQGNNDLSAFSGWPQNDGRYQDLLTKTHDAALRAGKFWGNAGAQFLTGNRLSADTRFVQNGPARDCWIPPARGRGRSSQEEPTVGIAPGAQPTDAGPGVTKGADSRTKALMMAFKLLAMAEERWRRVNGSELLPLVRAGVRFVDGVQEKATKTRAGEVKENAA